MRTTELKLFAADEKPGVFPEEGGLTMPAILDFPVMYGSGTIDLRHVVRRRGEEELRLREDERAVAAVDRILAIKRVRERTGVGLKEAKDAVDRAVAEKEW